MNYFLLFGAIGFILSVIIYFIFFRESNGSSLISMSFLIGMITISQVIVSLITNENTLYVSFIAFIGCVIFLLPLSFFPNITNVFSNVVGYFWIFNSLKQLNLNEDKMMELNISNMDDVLPGFAQRDILLSLMQTKQMIGDIIWISYSSLILLVMEFYFSSINKS
jgi:hypothetical protein